VATGGSGGLSDGGFGLIQRIATDTASITSPIVMTLPAHGAPSRSLRAPTAHTANPIKAIARRRRKNGVISSFPL
jgi:hypothetical protein